MNPGKSTFTDPKTSEGILRRFKRSQGQVRGLQRMAEEGRPFSELLDPTSATHTAMDSVASLLLEEYLSAWEAQAIAGVTAICEGQIATILRKSI